MISESHSFRFDNALYSWSCQEDMYADVNPLVTNGFSHPYHLDESTFILRDVRSNFSYLFHFSMKIM